MLQVTKHQTVAAYMWTSQQIHITQYHDITEGVHKVSRATELGSHL